MSRENAGDLPGRRVGALVGALKNARGDEVGFGLESVDFRDNDDKALSRPDEADELWREGEP